MLKSFGSVGEEGREGVGVDFFFWEEMLLFVIE